MDDQSQQPATQATNPQPVIQPSPAIPTNQQAKPKLEISDEAANALLAIHNLQVAERPKSKPPTKLLIAAAALVLLIIFVTYLMGAFKPSTGSTSSSSSSGLGLPSQSDQTSGNGTSNQINQDVKACSDPVNAATVC